MLPTLMNILAQSLYSVVVHNGMKLAVDLFPHLSHFFTHVNFTEKARKGEGELGNEYRYL